MSALKKISFQLGMRFTSYKLIYDMTLAIGPWNLQESLILQLFRALSKLQIQGSF